MNNFIAFIRWLLRGIFDLKVVVDDNEKLNTEAAARSDVEIVAPHIKVNTPANERKYRTPEMLELLRLIRIHESGKAGYDADYANNNKWTLTNKTVNDVYKLSRSQVLNGEPSSAIGGYQFLSKTLKSLMTSLRLTGNEIMTPLFQDDLAIALMIRRGLLDYMRGTKSLEYFGDALAMEWASLPVLRRRKGARRTVNRGQTYYAGDGLNKAFHKPEVIEKALRALKNNSWL